MNERTKKIMAEQRAEVFRLLNEFGLSVYEDEIAEDEEEELLKADSYNFFTLDFGDFKTTDNLTKLSQLIVVEYYSENRSDVDEMSIDIISMIRDVKGITFGFSKKDRLRMKETERYIDRISITFKRMIPIACRN